MKEKYYTEEEFRRKIKDSINMRGKELKDLQIREQEEDYSLEDVKRYL